MMILVWLALAAALIGAVAYAWRMKRRHETPEELRGDWWTRFEAEFRAYARIWDGTDGDVRHEPSRPPQRRDLAEGSF